jgi:hypothetical protein
MTMTNHQGPPDRARVTPATDRDPAAEAFAQAAPLFGLKPEDYGRVFTAQGTAYRLVGINLASCQHAIEAVRLSDGQRVAFANTGFPSLLAEQGEAR